MAVYEPPTLSIGGILEALKESDVDIRELDISRPDVSLLFYL